MARKFVTGDVKNVVCTQKRETTKAECQGCGHPVTITTPHSGDILCPKCMKSSSYSLVTDDGSKDS